LRGGEGFHEDNERRNKVMKIEIFGTGCPKCKKLFENAQKALIDLSLAADLSKVEDIQQIMNAGIMMTPALGVDGDVKSAGKVLSVDEIKKIISKTTF
jgi:small redox-active disulfide protein 2